MNKKGLLITLLLCTLFTVSSFAKRIPSTSFFRFYPGFGFTLDSNKGNTFKVSSVLEIPKGHEESLVVFMRAKMVWTYKDIDFKYYVWLKGDKDGNVYMSEISDEEYTRVFHDEVVIFPDEFEYKKPVKIGQNITFTFIEETTFEGDDVELAELMLADRKVLLYMTKRKGIVGMKFNEEIYKKY